MQFWFFFCKHFVPSDGNVNSSIFLFGGGRRVIQTLHQLNNLKKKNLSLFFLSWRSFWFNWAPHSMSVCVKYMCLNVCAMCKWCVLLVKHYITLSLKAQLLYKLYMILSFKHHSDSIMRRKKSISCCFQQILYRLHLSLIHGQVCSWYVCSFILLLALVDFNDVLIFICQLPSWDNFNIMEK